MRKFLLGSVIALGITFPVSAEIVDPPMCNTHTKIVELLTSAGYIELLTMVAPESKEHQHWIFFHKERELMITIKTGLPEESDGKYVISNHACIYSHSSGVKFKPSSFSKLFGPSV